MEMKVNDKLKKVIIGIAIAVLVFSIGMVIKIASLSIENSKLVDELSRKEAESMEMDEKNAALEALLNGENESVLMQQYAHENGYVYPDEYVYIYGN